MHFFFSISTATDFRLFINDWPCSAPAFAPINHPTDQQQWWRWSVTVHFLQQFYSIQTFNAACQNSKRVCFGYLNINRTWQASWYFSLCSKWWLTACWCQPRFPSTFGRLKSRHFRHWYHWYLRLYRDSIISFGNISLRGWSSHCVKPATVSTVWCADCWKPSELCRCPNAMATPVRKRVISSFSSDEKSHKSCFEWTWLSVIIAPFAWLKYKLHETIKLLQISDDKTAP